MDDIQALLFCGGRGTRLFPITDYYQKVMMPIGPEGRPILEYVISHLKKQGISNFVALIRYRANQIRRYFGDGEKFGVKIEYVLDKPDLKGTGAALLNVYEYINSKTFLVYFTDILSTLDLGKMYEFHQGHGKIATAWIDPSWQVKEGLVIVDNKNRVIGVKNKLVENIYANTGVALLDSSIFEILKRFRKEGGADIDLSGQIFPYLVSRNQMMAYLSSEWWLDVGSLSRHKTLNNETLNEKFYFG